MNLKVDGPREKTKEGRKNRKRKMKKEKKEASQKDLELRR
jgi:hypothetical protein